MLFTYFVSLHFDVMLHFYVCLLIKIYFVSLHKKQRSLLVKNIAKCIRLTIFVVFWVIAISFSLYDGLLAH